MIFFGFYTRRSRWNIASLGQNVKYGFRPVCLTSASARARVLFHARARQVCIRSAVAVERNKSIETSVFRQIKRRSWSSERKRAQRDFSFDPCARSVDVTPESFAPRKNWIEWSRAQRSVTMRYNPRRIHWMNGRRLVDRRPTPLNSGFFFFFKKTQ